MKVTVSDAKAQLTELVRRAEAGEEVVLTRHGHPAVTLVPVEKKPLTSEERRKILEDIVASAKPTPGPDAARSQDFLYDENGLPK
jgi:prevent-host-death family protein